MKTMWSRYSVVACPLCCGDAHLVFDNFESHALVEATCLACEDTGFIVTERSQRVYEPALRFYGEHRLYTTRELRALTAFARDYNAELVLDERAACA